MANTSKHRVKVLTIEDMREQAKRDATALKKACGGQNKAAKDIGMSKGRFSFIIHGQWTQVAVNEIDLAMLATGKAIREKDLEMTTEMRRLAEKLKRQLAEIHETVGDFVKATKGL